MKRIILPYNPALKELARKLRHNMTFSEVKLWSKLKNGKMMNYDFDRQRPILNYIVDFYCKDLLLAIEVDGLSHNFKEQIIKDKVRQKELELVGVTFIRFNALEVIFNTTNVCTAIENWILDYEERMGIPENVSYKRKRL